MHDPYVLPDDLPVPQDDGGAAHLPGLAIPHVPLASTAGGTVDLAAVPGTVVVFAYPRTGRPGVALPEGWDEIPGARGCTPHTLGYRDLHPEFVALGATVFGLSTQDSAYQRELAQRLDVPFGILSDEHLALTHALHLPTMDVHGMTLIKRLAWIARDGVIERVFYPVFPPDRNAVVVLDALRKRGRSSSDEGARP
ncbi:MAG: peroxiredoxin [Candidatus Lustribacter sp.]|jgi:peroxiredoxin